MFGAADRVVPVEAGVEAVVGALSRNERGSRTRRVFPGPQPHRPARAGRRAAASVLDRVVEATEAGRLP